MGSAKKMKKHEQQQEIRRPAQVSQPIKPRQFTAPACSLCAAIRPDGTNYSRIYGTVTREKTIVRYVRCHFCNNTWTVSSQLSNAAEIQSESQQEPR